MTVVEEVRWVLKEAELAHDSLKILFQQHRIRENPRFGVPGGKLDCVDLRDESLDGSDPGESFMLS